MRVYDETVAPSGKKRIIFACGIEDIKILYGLATKAKMSMPSPQQVPELAEIEHRLSSMTREFGRYLGRPDKIPREKTHKCPYCERTLRGEKALEGHISTVHSKGI